MLALLFLKGLPCLRSAFYLWTTVALCVECCCDAQKLISSLDNVEKGQGLRKFQFGPSRQIYFLIFSSTL
jgi:hypothetical protein